MNLADNIKRIRKENNLSQEQLAEQLGVSRQSVSKWESNQAYPEMDKVLQISKMFNIGVDDLLNQNINEINKEKQSKIDINKYIDDFFSFITKTIDMFASMKFKEKIKCLMEQGFIIFCLFIVFLIIGSIGDNILFGLTSMLPFQIESIIYSICGSIYTIFALVLGIILIIHIFKIRYLDYYEIVKESVSEELNTENKIDESEKKENKEILEKKIEKVVIRDPKHSEYRFTSGLLKCLLFFVKCFALLFALTLCITLICFVLSLVVSFLIAETGLFFIGVLLSLVACIIANLVILIILFNFIVNRKSKKGTLLISFLLSLVLLGVGIGVTTVGFTEFDYIDNLSDTYYIKDEVIIPMEDDLILTDYYDDCIEYIEEDRKDIRIEYIHSDTTILNYHNNHNNELLLSIEYKDSNFMSFSREVLKDIKDKKIINYSSHKIYVYTSKSNINKLEKNKQKLYDEQYNETLSNLQEEINELRIELYEKEDKIRDLEDQLDNEKYVE